MDSLELSTAAMLSAAAVATGAYLNAKFSLGTDLSVFRGSLLWRKHYIDRLQKLGDTCTLYAIFDAVDTSLDVLWFEGRTWTYGELKRDVDRLAAFLHSKGISAGMCVGVFMSNSPELAITVLALSKLGAVAGLINSALRDDTLAYCMKIACAQLVLSTPELSDFFDGSLPHFSLSLGGFSQFPSPSGISAVSIGLHDLPASPQPLLPAKRTKNDLAVLIFTSGTTGKPKACAIRNNQFVVVSTPLYQDLNDPNRYFPLRQYSALPLFHGTGLFTGFSYSIGNAGCFCLSRKFSTSKFWKEVTESRATRIIYVGELCRYLVAAPPSPYDRAHQCIVANGNGLRGEVWDKFKERFNVPEIREFYRSTEGVGRFDNFGVGEWGKGKIGFSGPLARYLEDFTFIVKMDLDTEMPYRDPKTGFCVRAELGEPGEVIGRVVDRQTLSEYLNNTEATEEKLLRDVFKKGDVFQRMGDLVVQDSEGWVSFHDRIGDTFRWKGENVSAGEVRDHVSKIDGVVDVAVYGVKLGRYDGQAGAAAITLESRTPETEAAFMKALYSKLKKTGLPGYAMPRLVRIIPEMVTGFTFKQAKAEYKSRTWNPASEDRGDALYWLDGTVYKKLGAEEWQGIEAGRAKL